MSLLAWRLALLVLFGASCVGTPEPMPPKESRGVNTKPANPRRDFPLFDSSPAPAGFPRMVRCAEAVVSAGELDAPPSQEDKAEAATVLSVALGERWASHASEKEWRILARTDQRVVVARGDPPGLVRLILERRNGGWRTVAKGGCTTEPSWGESVTASWEVDKRFPPQASDETLHLLIAENACRSGIDPRPRLETPRVVYGEATVTIALFVRPPPGKGTFTCVGPPPVPIVVELDEPLGDRELLDGGVYPPQPANPLY
jgi:hypothetical protein